MKRMEGLFFKFSVSFLYAISKKKITPKYQLKKENTISVLAVNISFSL